MTERDFIKHYGSLLSDEDDLVEAEHFHDLLAKTLEHFFATRGEGDDVTLLDFASWLQKVRNE